MNPCAYYHSENGLNYPWLDHIHNGLSHIMYEEPAGSGIWREYTDETWKIHCKVISHKPESLVQDHIESFIDPDTRFARLMFIFKDGTQMEPIPYFYQLERQWLMSRNCCN